MKLNRSVQAVPISPPFLPPHFSAGCIDVGGGLFGDDTTNRLLQDLRADPDGIIPLVVFPRPTFEFQFFHFRRGAV